MIKSNGNNVFFVLLYLNKYIIIVLLFHETCTSNWDITNTIEKGLYK